MKLQPFPSAFNITKDDTLTQVWFTWFRNLSQNMVQACNLTSATNYKYTINNSQITIIYNGNGNESLLLPYKIATNQILNYWIFDGNVNDYVLKMLSLNEDDEQISLPSGNIKINFGLIIKQINK